jgi:RNA polymerase sigma factor (sigma-70 family)
MVLPVRALLGMGCGVDASDSGLLASAAAGDAHAFAAFYRRHVAAVTGLAVRLGATLDDVADIVSETFIVALARAGRYTAVSDTARPWLLGIAWRVAQHGFRRRARQFRLHRRLRGDLPRFADDEAEAIAAAVDAARLTPELEAALARLPQGERRVLELVAYTELTPTEAAVALGISANAARLRLSRARQRLRALAFADGPFAAIEVKENRS